MLQAEILADIIVSKVAEQVVIHLRKLVEAVDCGSTIGSIEIPEVYYDHWEIGTGRLSA